MAEVLRKSVANFEYSPLCPGQIRILRLAPDKRDNALFGELITTQLDENKIEYDALSYMWGDPTPTDSIWLSSKALPITSNLRSALNHLRYEDRPLIIWIDAVCINQGNDLERVEQVQLMRRLYRGAKVRIWIDEPAVEETSDAVVALQNFPHEIDFDDINLGASHESLGNDPTFWNPVLPIFQNGYWRRAWYDICVLLHRLGH